MAVTVVVLLMMMTILMSAAAHILTTCRLQLGQLEQLPRTRVTVADLAALPLHHQAALVHASHVMASIQ